MVVHPQTRKSPEAYVKVLITIIEKTPHGGASKDDLKEAYYDVKDTLPSDKTIHRYIRRLNELFNPAAFAGCEPNSKQDGKKAGQRKIVNPKDLAIRSQRLGDGTTRYIYTGKKLVSNYDSSQALLIILGLYSQQRSILRGHFKKVISTIMKEVLARQDGGESFLSEIDDHVHVSGHGSDDARKIVRRINEIVRAIDNCKVVKIDYIRTYDGERRKREVEPYGLACRHGNWYFVGLCRWHNEMRIFLIDQVKKLEVLENSTFKRPADFKIKDVFGEAWGIMISNDAKKPQAEKVRLRVKKGVAARFEAVRFHDSQETRSLPGDEVEVSFEVSGANEMIPWLVSWGGTLEVLEPQWLKDQLLAYVQAIANVYK